MPDEMTNQRFDQLLSEYIEGRMSEESGSEFAALLKSEPVHTEMLLEQLMMDARLEQFESEGHSAEHFVAGLAATFAAETTGAAFVDRVMEQAGSGDANGFSRAETIVDRSLPTMAASMAGALLVGAFLVIGIGLWQGSWNEAVGEPIIARFGELDNCRWVDSEASVESGDLIHIGQRIELSSGFAEVLFKTGARMDLVGPAIVEARAENRVFLTMGEVDLEAETPESKGFTVETPTSTFVDISTAFTATVSPDGLSRLQVTEGEVDVVLDGIDPNRLKQGDTLYIEPGERKIMTRIESGDETAAFRFPTVGPPSRLDYADQASGHATIRVVRGQLRTQSTASGSAAVLLDGAGQPKQDAPRQSAFFETGIKGRFLIDLGQPVAIEKINSYSWHQHDKIEEHRERARQRFTLYGFSGDALPDLKLPLENSEWTRIARVNSDEFFRVNKRLDRPAQQVCSISAARGDIGHFRYLLWDMKANSFYGEFDVFGAPRLSEIPIEYDNK